MINEKIISRMNKISKDHASEQIHPEKQASHSLHYSDDATEDDKQDDDVNNQHLPKDSIYEPINPDSPRRT